MLPMLMRVTVLNFFDKLRVDALSLTLSCDSTDRHLNSFMHIESAP